MNEAKISTEDHLVYFDEFGTRNGEGRREGEKEGSKGGGVFLVGFPMCNLKN